MLEYIFMICFDSIFSIFIVLNLVVFIWRIIWDTQDLYLDIDTNSEQININIKYFINSIVSIAVSFLLMLYVKYKQVKSQLNESLYNPTNTKNWKTKAKIKFFIIVFSFVNINQWRGVWYLTLYATSTFNAATNSTFQNELDSDIQVASICESRLFFVGTCSFIGLIVMNRLCALISVPYILNKDCAELAFQIHPSSNKSNNYLKLNEYNIKMTKWLFMWNFMLEYFADIFTIQSWRCLWLFLDHYLYPDNSLKSASISLSIGLSIYLILHMLNKPINNISVKKHSKYIENSNHNDFLINTDERENYEKQKLSKGNRFFLYIIFMLACISTVNSWRALWMFQLEFCYNLKLFHNELINKCVLNLIYMILCLSLLWLLHLTSAILSRASCEDDYFTAKNNFILKHNNFKSFIQKRVKSKKYFQAINIKELIDYKQFFNKCVEDKELKRERFERLLYQLNERNEIVLKLQENNV